MKSWQFCVRGIPNVAWFLFINRWMALCFSSVPTGHIWTGCEALCSLHLKEAVMGSVPRSAVITECGPLCCGSAFLIWLKSLSSKTQGLWSWMLLKVCRGWMFVHRAYTLWESHKTVLMGTEQKLVKLLTKSMLIFWTSLGTSQVPSAVSVS